jgi:cytoskeletal protein RodZ
LGQTHRLRTLIKEFEENKDIKNKDINTEEIKIFYKRARVLQTAIMFSVISICLVVIMMLSLFFSILFKIDLSYIVFFSFVLALLTLIVSILYYLYDFRISMHAIKLELKKLE